VNWMTEGHQTRIGIKIYIAYIMFKQLREGTLHILYVQYGASHQSKSLQYLCSNKNHCSHDLFYTSK